MKNWFPRRINILIILLVVAILIPIFFRSPFLLHVFVLLMIWIILAESLNFVTGFAGQLALGHAAFVTIGGYVGSLLNAL
jgi:branched-chain amino acid transport system permease protein